MDNIIRDWFSVNHITLLNIYTVSMIITEINNNKDNKDNTDSTKLLTSKSIYHEVIQILIRDNKIELLEGIKLIDSFDVMDRSGLIDEYSFLVCSLTNNPNLINNKCLI